MSVIDKTVARISDLLISLRHPLSVVSLGNLLLIVIRI